jgi:hypothetical protein
MHNYLEAIQNINMARLLAENQTYIKWEVSKNNELIIFGTWNCKTTHLIIKTKLFFSLT